MRMLEGGESKNDGRVRKRRIGENTHNMAFQIRSHHVNDLTLHSFP